MLVIASIALLLVAHKTWAQGCIVGRECSSGAVGSNYLMPHQFEFSLNYRGFKANKHYNGDVRQVLREVNHNFVINRQNIWDATGTWGLNRQTSSYLDIPFVNSGWSFVPKAGGPRWQQNSVGIGDVAFGLQYWLQDTNTHQGGNVQLGFGIQAPTGNDNNKDYYPNIPAPGTVSEKGVDQSIQPGDGSWDFPVSLQAFHSIGRFNIFAVANYLITPRDTNGVPSIITNLGLKPSALAPSQAVNSVPDQYLVRIGVATAMPFVKNVTGAVAFRDEGVPVHDLIGAHHGWRRAGYSHSIEPALTYTRGDSTFTVDVRLTIRRDREPTDPDGTYVAGDSTFADSQLILNFTQRYNPR